MNRLLSAARRLASYGAPAAARVQSGLHVGRCRCFARMAPVSKSTYDQRSPRASPWRMPRASATDHRAPFLFTAATFRMRRASTRVSGSISYTAAEGHRSRRRRCAPPLARLPHRALPWRGPPGARRATLLQHQHRSARLNRLSGWSRVRLMPSTAGEWRSTWCLCGCLTRFGSCLRASGRSTRHDPLPRPLHTGKFGPRGASTRTKHHAAAARSG